MMDEVVQELNRGFIETVIIRLTLFKSGTIIIGHTAHHIFYWKFYAHNFSQVSNWCSLINFDSSPTKFIFNFENIQVTVIKNFDQSLFLDH